MWTLGRVGFQANPVLLRQEIGRRVRAAREAAGLNLTDAALRLEIARSSVSRLENGLTMMSVHLARSMMDIYDFYDEDLLNLVRFARERGWWRQYGFSDKHFVAVESGAAKLSSFEPELVPGLLQTADYARALFSASGLRRSAEWIDKQLEVRMIRQERLVDDEQPLKLAVVIGENALRRPVGDAEVMRAQLRHLVLITELPTVSLRVLPASVITDDATYGAFFILDFPYGPSMVHLEHILGSERTDKPDLVSSAKLRLDRMRSLALGSAESCAMIEWVADNL